MKKLTLLILFMVSLNCLGQTQLEMNEEAATNYNKIDKELNVVYQKILKEYKADTKFISKFKEAQRAWIKFRDAEMEAQFPEDDKQLNYGSVFPMCWSMVLEDLTKERIKKLKVWLDGIEEGDVCSGSIKIK